MIAQPPHDRPVHDRSEVAALTAAISDLVVRGGGVVAVIGPHGSDRAAVVEEALHRLDLADAATDVVRCRPGDTADVGLGARLDASGVLVVHDAHDADSGSVAALVDRARDRRHGLVAVLVHDGTVDRQVPSDALVVVRPLAADDVRARILARGLDGRVRTGDVLAHTGGLGDLVDDVLDDLSSRASGLGDRLGATTATRAHVHSALASLPDAARAVVQHVAVLGTLELDDLAGLLAPEHAPAEVIDAVDTAVGTGLVRVVDGGPRLRVAPSAPVWAAAVLESMPVAVRFAVHRRRAETTTDELDAALHRLHATAVVDESVVDEVLALGRLASGRGEWQRAAEALRAAALGTRDEERRARLMPAVVDAAVGAGDMVAAALPAIRLASSPVSAEREAALGYHAIMLGRPDRAAAYLHRAWARCNPRTDPDTAVRVAGRIALQSLCAWDGAALEEWGERAARLGLVTSAARIEAECIGQLGTAILGDAASARRRLATILHEHPIGPHRQRAALAAGWVELATGDPDLATHWLEEATGDRTGEGSVRIAMWGLGWLARARFEAGEWRSAMRLVEAGTALADRTELGLVVPLIAWTGAQISALRGRWDTADRYVSRAAASPDSYPVMRVPAALARAVVHEARSDYAGVVRHLGPVARMAGSRDVDEPGFWDWHQPYVNALVVLGRVDEADATLTPLEERAQRRGRPAPIAIAATQRGRILGARGDIDAAVVSFARAREAAAEARRAYQAARIDFVEGLVLRRAGRRREADETLQRALALHQDLGATTYVARIERELKATGVSGNVSRGTGSAQLTAQERAVASLVAGGRSNADVARELSLSVKTVQYHLTNVYAKLHVRSRTELAASWRPHDE